MSDKSQSVKVWSSTGQQFIAVGPDGGSPQQSIPVDLDGWKAGVMDYDGVTFDWTQETDELIFVLSGSQTLTHEGKPFTSAAGDVVLIKEGTHLTFSGSDDCRIAYANGHSAGGPDVPVGTWTAAEIGANADGTAFGYSSTAGYVNIAGESMTVTAGEAEFLWVVSGQVELTAGTASLHLGEGDIALIRGGTYQLDGTSARVAYYRN